MEVKALETLIKLLQGEEEEEDELPEQVSITIQLYRPGQNHTV